MVGISVGVVLNLFLIYLYLYSLFGRAGAAYATVF
jgi:Na+-driven multidrug efflux pump